MNARHGLVLGALLLWSCGPSYEPDIGGAERFIADQVEDVPIPGVAAAIVKNGAVAWSKGFGFADLERQEPMTPDTVMNVASISKTFVNAAVLKLWQEHNLDLDEDVRAYLPFPFDHPRHSGAPVTFRQLLTHTASIADGPSYEESYACGDPRVVLREWIEEYFTPGGRYYDAEKNFHEWAPGERYAYSNVGFGLLAYLVERVSGLPFSLYALRELFRPLKMTESAFFLVDLERDHHAVPYAFLERGTKRDNPFFQGVEPGSVQEEDGFVPYCLYSFSNYPDGLVRTSVHQLARFLLAHVDGGVFEGRRILEEETVAAVFEDQGVTGGELQGLTWAGNRSEESGLYWGHSGSDPGVTTTMLFHAQDGVGVIVFANRNVDLGPIVRRLFQAAETL